MNICDEHILFFKTCLVQGFVRVITCESADPSTFVHGQIWPLRWYGTAGDINVDKSTS